MFCYLLYITPQYFNLFGQEALTYQLHGVPVCSEGCYGVLFHLVKDLIGLGSRWLLTIIY